MFKFFFWNTFTVLMGLRRLGACCEVAGRSQGIGGTSERVFFGGFLGVRGAVF
jgi:hypothetical protein